MPLPVDASMSGFSGPRARLRFLDGTFIGTAFVMFDRPSLMNEVEEIEWQPWWGFIEFDAPLTAEYHERIDDFETFELIEGAAPGEPSGGAPVRLRVVRKSSGINEGRHCYLVYESLDDGDGM